MHFKYWLNWTRCAGIGASIMAAIIFALFLLIWWSKLAVQEALVLVYAFSAGSLIYIPFGIGSLLRSCFEKITLSEDSIVHTTKYGIEKRVQLEEVIAINDLMSGFGVRVVGQNYQFNIYLSLIGYRECVDHLKHRCGAT